MTTRRSFIKDISLGLGSLSAISLIGSDVNNVPKKYDLEHSLGDFMHKCVFQHHSLKYDKIHDNSLNDVPEDIKKQFLSFGSLEEQYAFADACPLKVDTEDIIKELEKKSELRKNIWKQPYSEFKNLTPFYIGCFPKIRFIHVDYFYKENSHCVDDKIIEFIINAENQEYNVICEKNKTHSLYVYSLLIKNDVRFLPIKNLRDNKIGWLVWEEIAIV